jgi:hypothetical protein
LDSRSLPTTPRFLEETTLACSSRNSD